MSAEKAARCLRLEHVTPEQRVYFQRRDGSIVEFFADAFLAAHVLVGDLDLANTILDVLDRGKVPVIEQLGDDGSVRVWDARIAPLQSGGVA